MSQASKAINPKAEVASGEYDRRRAAGIQQPGIGHIERLFKLKQGQLRHYRANYVSRKRRPRAPYHQFSSHCDIFASAVTRRLRLNIGIITRNVARICLNSSMCLAMNEAHMLATQSSDGSHHAEHVKKIMALPVARLLAYHMTIEIWSWSLKLTGRRKFWAHLLGSPARSRSCGCGEPQNLARFCEHDLAVGVVS
jgi:hypothetical protein